MSPRNQLRSPSCLATPSARAAPDPASGAAVGARPLLSIVVPLVDTRGVEGWSLRAWSEQTLPAADYEVVVVSAERHPGIASRIRAKDRIVFAPGVSEAAMYAAGCRAAQGGILLLTEAHCIPARDTAAELVRWFAASRMDAAHVDGPGIGSAPLGRMEERMNLRHRRSRSGIDDWTIASFRGLAVRRVAFDQAGGIDVEIGRLAEKMLAFRLVARRCRIGRAEGAILRHVNARSWAELANALSAYGRSLGAYWARCEASGEAPIVDPFPLFRRRRARDREVARETFRLLIGAVRRGSPGERARDALALARRAPSLLAASLCGARGSVWRGRTRAGAARALCLLAGRCTDERLWPRFRFAWQALTELGVAQSVAAERCARPSSGPLLRPGEMADGDLVGFHAAEDWGGRRVRWTEPLAMVPLVLPPSGADLELEILTAGDPLELRGVSFWLGGRRLPARGAQGHRTTMRWRIEPGWLPEAGGYLAITCAPLARRWQRPEDRRRLGVVLLAIGVSSAGSAGVVCSSR